MSEPDPSDICFPITSINAVLNWNCDKKCWIHKHDVADISESSSNLNIGYDLDSRGKNSVFSEYKLSSKMLPKTIFCHDYKGGYVEDRFCNGTPVVNTYRFFNWSSIDIFIYFSHKLVTIPTQGWLNAGHIHGIPVLGTLITEWDDGETAWRHILTDTEKTNLFSQKLAEVCAHYKFDGYLLNVENKIPKDFIPRLVQFVGLLKAHLDLYCDRRTWLIWYDSVTTEGNLAWQNKLCPLNKPFFDACDGIFLNYVWKPSDLLESKELAGNRKYDVFVGVDVWGRNCYQDGGFNVSKAMSVIRSLNMSVALFAPGWTFETMVKGDNFLQREKIFWKDFWPHLYVHGPSSLPFQTNFCQGITFQKDTGSPWFNLGMQQYQPTGQGCSQCGDQDCISLYLNDGLEFIGACLKISAVSAAHSKIFHRIFTCYFSGFSDKSSNIIVTLGLKNIESDPARKFRIYFVLEDRASIDGVCRVSMSTRPKGYRASMTLAPGVTVAGSLIDFTAADPTPKPKIKVYQCDSDKAPWHQVQFQLEIGAGEAITEILLLPAPTGAMLWGFLKVEKLS